MTIGRLPIRSTCLLVVLVASCAASSSISAFVGSQEPPSNQRETQPIQKTEDPQQASSADESDEKLAERAKREAAQKEAMEKAAREAARKRGEFTLTISNLKSKGMASFRTR